MQKPIAWIQPTEGRKQPVGVAPELIPNRFQPGRRRQNAVSSCQSVDLGPIGNECDQIDNSDQSEKPASSLVKRRSTGGVLAPTPEQCCDMRRQFAMTSNDSVCKVGERSESRNELITPERNPARNSRAFVPRAEDRFGAAIDFSVSGDQPNSRLKTFNRDIFVETAYK